MNASSATKKAVMACASLLVIVVSADHAAAQAAEARGNKDHFGDFSVEAEAVFSDQVGPVRIAKVILGKLPAGKRGVATVRIENPFEYDLPIASIRPSSSYIKSRIPQRIIPAGASVPLEVKFEVPSRNSGSTFEARIQISIDRTEASMHLPRAIIIGLNYSIDGLLSFVDFYSTIRVRSGEAIGASIPFVTTLDEPVEDLIVDATGFLLGVSGSVVEGDKPGFGVVKIDVSSEDATAEGVSGRLTLRSKRSQAVTYTNVLLRLDDALRISPSILRFRPVEDRFTSVAIVEVTKSTAAVNETGASSSVVGNPNSEDGSLYCEAYLGDLKIPVTHQRLRGNIYRVSLAIPAEHVEELHADAEKHGNEARRFVRWHVTHNKNAYTAKSALFFSSN